MQKDTGSLHELTPVNNRSPEMWSYIERYVNDVLPDGFKNKMVIDLGCGFCDLAIFAAQAGASVFAVEKDSGVFERTETRLHAGARSDRRLLRVTIVQNDVDTFTARDYGPPVVDIAFCTSVLPYLQKPDQCLKWLATYIPISIIECQYAGDGPGFKHIRNDVAMKAWLNEFWPTDGIKIIGNTFVPGRDKVRTIWGCRGLAKIWSK